MSVAAERLVFVHSPLVGAETWLPVANELANRGLATLVPSLSGVRVDGPGFWERCANEVRAAAGHPSPPAVLVGHSGIGPVLPYIAATLGNVAGCVYADASLPAAGKCWLDSFPTAPAIAADGLVPNMWTDEATWALVGIGDEGRQHRLAGSARRLPFDIYREPYPTPPGWEALPSGFLAFVPNMFYAPIAARARSLGWPTLELAGSHFHMLVDPGGVADSLLALLAETGMELRCASK